MLRKNGNTLFSSLLILLVLGLILLIAPTALAANEDWEAMFEQEWRAMGLTTAPEVMPAPGGSYGSGNNGGTREFPYSLITPAAKNTPDAQALVIVLLADGFTSSQADQAKWRYYCQYFARNFVKYKPFNEFADNVKIYRIDVVSNNSGVTRSDSPDGRNMPDDPKGTYFSGLLWSSGMARLGGYSSTRATNMANAYFPSNTNSNKTVLFNTSIYGGSGGSTSCAGLSWSFVDVTTHEIGHAAGGLPDHYLYSGTSQLTGPRGNYQNQMTVVHRNWINDPAWQAWNPWYRLLGKNGTTFDPWLEGLSTDADFINLFRAIPDCKMRYVGANFVLDATGEEEFGFCEICKEQWRDRICRTSNTPVLHFQPYNDQFYDSAPVALNNKNFILRLPVAGVGGRCVMVYGEEIDATNAKNGVLGTFKMTVFKDGVPLPQYTDIPANTAMTLAAGVYSVEANFTGTYNGTPRSLNLASLDNEFEVKPQTVISKVGKYDEPWNSSDKMDTLSRPWIKDTPVMLPELVIDPTRVGATSISQFDITYSWHVRNFDGSSGTLLSGPVNYGVTINGPSSVGQYVLEIHSKANASAPPALANYDVTNYFSFDISTPYRAANHYNIAGGTYSHELGSNDFRAITIVGEGFTEAEQDEFEAVAEDFITKFLDTDPVKRMTERFSFFIENTMSADSGLSKENGLQKDTYYGFKLNADGSLGTYREDTMDVILFQDVWRRDTNLKTYNQWGTTVVLINEKDVQANYNWRHPEANRGVHLSTIADPGYKRLIESVVTQFAHVRSNRDLDLLDTYRWMEGDGFTPNKTFQETYERLVESCYSHEMYGSGNLNLPRPVIVSDAAVKTYKIIDGQIYDITNPLNKQPFNVAATFKAYSFGHELRVNTVAADTFTYRYYKDNNYRVGAQLPGLPSEPGAYWAEADLPSGAKYYAKTETDRYGFTYNAGQQLQGVNGTGTSSSARVRGFVRFEILPPTYNYHVYLLPDQAGLSVGETVSLDVMLAGDLNYTQLSTEIAYDTNLLKYEGYADLKGIVAAVSPLADGKISVRSVPSLNMVFGEPCDPDVKIVTLKFKLLGNFSEDKTTTACTFASININPPAGFIGARIAPGEELPLIIYENDFTRSFYNNLALYPEWVGVDDQGLPTTMPIFSYTSDFITERVWVEVPCDTDRDGIRDRVSLWIRRPITKEGFKCPVVMEFSPYHSGTRGYSRMSNYINSEDDLLQGMAESFQYKDNSAVNLTVNPDTTNLTYNDIKYKGTEAWDPIWWQNKGAFTVDSWYTGVNPGQVPAATIPSALGTAFSITWASGSPTPSASAIPARWNHLYVRGYAMVFGQLLGNRDSHGITNTLHVEEWISVAAACKWFNGEATAYTTQWGDVEVKADWASGLVAMDGGSYPGTTPTVAAMSNITGLKAIMPEANVTSWYEYYRSGGALHGPEGYGGEDMNLHSSYNFSRVDADLSASSNSNIIPPNGPNFPLVAQQAYVMTQRYMMAGQDRVSADYNVEWDARNLTRGYGKMPADLGILQTNGQQDWNVMPRHAYMMLQAMRDRFPGNAPEAFGTHKIVSALTKHAAQTGRLVPGKDGVERGMQKWYLMFLDHYLLHLNNHVDDLMYDINIANSITGAMEGFDYDTAVEERGTIIPGTHYEKIYLVPGPQGKAGRLSYTQPASTLQHFEDMNMEGQINAPQHVGAPARPSTTFTFSNSQGNYTPSTAQINYCDDRVIGVNRNTADYGTDLTLIDAVDRPVEGRLMYISEPLSESVQLSGTVVVHLQMAPTKGMGNLTVALVEIGRKQRVAVRIESVSTAVSSNVTVFPAENGAAAATATRYTNPVASGAASNFKYVTWGHTDVQNPSYDGKAWFEVPEQNYTPNYYFQTTKLVPGQYYDYVVELNPYNYIFEPGMRIGLMVYGTDVMASPSITAESACGFDVRLGAGSYIRIPFNKAPILEITPAFVAEENVIEMLETEAEIEVIEVIE
ncbi:MAG: M64 family metallo-endopeptidase [Firmicutes bacterium]|nr:M64 family metallo-endopeptidase [Bacillota bacterium]